VKFDMMALETLIAGAGDDPALADLFGGQDRLKTLRHKQQLQGDAELRVAQAILNVFMSEDGKVLFDYLAASTFRRFENITALGLPSETAIQLHAERDGRMGLVSDLFRMIRLAQNPPAQPKEA
jgi:hypothetical protein